MQSSACGRRRDASPWGCAAISLDGNNATHIPDVSHRRRQREWTPSSPANCKAEDGTQPACLVVLASWPKLLDKRDGSGIQSGPSAERVWPEGGLVMPLRIQSLHIKFEREEFCLGQERDGHISGEFLSILMTTETGLKCISDPLSYPGLRYTSEPWALHTRVQCRGLSGFRPGTASAKHVDGIMQRVRCTWCRPIVIQLAVF